MAIDLFLCNFLFGQSMWIDNAGNLKYLLTILQETNAFIADPRVTWAQIDEITEVEADFVPADPSFLSGDQW